MEKKELIDETFDSNRTESYTLSVQASLNGFSYCIKDTVRDCFISLVTFPFDHSLSAEDDWSNPVNNFFSERNILNKKFKKVYLSYESPLFTIVPTEFFTPEKAKQLFELVHPLPDLFEVRYNHIKEINATILFAIPSSLTSFWLFKQAQTEFIGHATPLVFINSLARGGKDEPAIHANFADQFFVNAISMNNELKHCNSFTLHNDEDTAYHLVNSCRLNGIDPSKSILTINGNIESTDALEKLLSNYFKKVTIDSGSDGHHYSYSIVKYKKIHWNLFNLSQCE